MSARKCRTEPVQQLSMPSERDIEASYSKKSRFANRFLTLSVRKNARRLCDSADLRHVCLMAILKLARLGHPVLLARTEPINDPAAPEIGRLLRDMAETLDDAGGVGLAAPQVHVPLRLFIYRVPKHRATDAEGDGPRDLSAVINPVLVLHEGEPVEDWEGCLSIPGMSALVPRAPRITLRAQDVSGASFTREAAGFHARVIQHEADHLDGILYPQRMRDLRLLGFNEEVARFRDEIGQMAEATP